MNSTVFDLIIVGNGAIGLACAFELSDRHAELKIAIVGPPSRPHSASMAAGAMLGCHGEITAQGLSSEHGRLKFEWRRCAKSLWPEWLTRMGQGYTSPTLVEGTFVLSNAVSGTIDDENFRAILQSLRADDVFHEEVDPRDVPGLRPTMDARPLRVVHIPSEHAVNALEYLSCLEQNLRANPRITFIDDLVGSLRLHRDGSIGGVRLYDGKKLTAETVLLAAGIGCQALLEQCPPLKDRVPRIFAGVGSSVVAGQPACEPIKHVLRTPNRAFACGLHVVPRRDKIYIGATNTIREWNDLEPHLVDLQFLLNSVIPQISEPIHASPLRSIATGSRPVTSDGLPLLGETSVSGLFIATGTFRDGIQLSPLIAQQVATMIVRDDLPTIPKNPFGPERQPLWTLSIDEAVVLCAAHYISVFYENGCHPPKVGWEDFLLEVLRKEVREIYEPFGTKNLPPIDFVHLLRERRKRGVTSTL